MVTVILWSRALSSVSTLLAMTRPKPDFLTLRSALYRALISAEDLDLNVAVFVATRFFIFTPVLTVELLHAGEAQCEAAVYHYCLGGQVAGGGEAEEAGDGGDLI